jgi:hypothetical protein
MFSFQTFEFQFSENKVPIYVSPNFSKGHIFSHVPPFYEQAASNLDP